MIYAFLADAVILAVFLLLLHVLSPREPQREWRKERLKFNPRLK